MPLFKFLLEKIALIFWLLVAGLFVSSLFGGPLPFFKLIVNIRITATNSCIAVTSGKSLAGFKLPCKSTNNNVKIPELVKAVDAEVKDKYVILGWSDTDCLNPHYLAWAKLWLKAADKELRYSRYK